MTIEQAEKDLRTTIDKSGPYGRNIASAILRVVAYKHGYKAANKLVVDFKIKEKYDIERCWPAIDMLKNKKTAGFKKPTVEEYSYS